MRQKALPEPILIGLQFRLLVSSSAEVIAEEEVARMNKRMPVVFVSHSGNNEFLSALQRNLVGFELIISDWRDESGSFLAGKVKEDIRRADLVVVLLSEEASRSPWVNQEVGFALALDKGVIPVSSIKTLPAMLQGVEFEPYDQAESTAARTALRISGRIGGSLIRVFQNLFEYREWWLQIDERLYTSDVCLSAVPHDSWPWLVPMDFEKRSERGVIYQHLIRGSGEFDRQTVELHRKNGEKAVCGVTELGAFEEFFVLGTMVVESVYEEPELLVEMDRLFNTAPTPAALVDWHTAVSRRRSKIEMRISFDEEHANALRKRFDYLCALHSRSDGSPTLSTSSEDE